MTLKSLFLTVNTFFFNNSMIKISETWPDALMRRTETVTMCSLSGDADCADGSKHRAKSISITSVSPEDFMGYNFLCEGSPLRSENVMRSRGLATCDLLLHLVPLKMTRAAAAAAALLAFDLNVARPRRR